jgi:hypothetical protein
MHSYRRSRAARSEPQDPGAPALLHRYATLLLIGFSLFVLAEARRRGIRRIYFLARDGYLPLAMVRKMIAQSGEPFELVYLRVSRASIADPALDGDPSRREAALAYLEREGFLAPGKRLVVDVGWRGTIQTGLARLAGIPENDIIGCYLGLLPAALRPGFGPANAVGYLFAFGYPKSVMDAVLDGYVLLELFLSAPHQPVLGYSPAGEPIFAEEDANGDSIRRLACEAIERGCMAEFSTLEALLGGAWPETLDRATALFDVHGLLTRPSRHEVAVINRIPFIHEPDGGTVVAVNPVPLHEFVLDLGQVVRRFENAPWRAGAIRASLPSLLPDIGFQDFRNRVTRLRRVLRRA